MQKYAVFCPRLTGESEGAWHSRLMACRQYLRGQRVLDALEFDSLEHLRMNYRKHCIDCVIVAHSGYYKLEFFDWVRHEAVNINDVLLPKEESLSARAFRENPRFAPNNRASRGWRYAAG